MYSPPCNFSYSLNKLPSILSIMNTAVLVSRFSIHALMGEKCYLPVCFLSNAQCCNLIGQKVVIDYLQLQWTVILTNSNSRISLIHMFHAPFFIGSSSFTGTCVSPDTLKNLKLIRNRTFLFNKEKCLRWFGEVFWVNLGVSTLQKSVNHLANLSYSPSNKGLVRTDELCVLIREFFFFTEILANVCSIRGINTQLSSKWAAIGESAMGGWCEYISEHNLTNKALVIISMNQVGCRRTEWVVFSVIFRILIHWLIYKRVSLFVKENNNIKHYVTVCRSTTKLKLWVWDTVCLFCCIFIWRKGQLLFLGNVFWTQ